jgi:hypothetical protein
MALYSRPSDIVTAGATWSVQAGSVDALYPLANLSDAFVYTVAKSGATTITYRATFAGAQSLDAIAFINTNATAIQVTNGAGLNEAVTIPALPLDGLYLDPWVDLRTVANASSTTWDIALTGPSGVALGMPVLVETLRELKIQWTPNPSDRETHRTIVHVTDYGVKKKLGLGVRYRGLHATALGEEVRDDLLALERDTQGQFKNFLLIRDEDDTDAMLVDLATDLREFLYVAPTETAGQYLDSITLDFDEQQKGWL